MINVLKITNDVEHFKSLDSPNNSIVTLAGTGPNGGCQIPLLHILSYDYLRQVKTLNVISASAFSFFIFLANHHNKLNIAGFLDHEDHTRQTHGFPFVKLLANLIRGNPKKNLYDNQLISKAIDNLFLSSFSSLQLKDIDLPVNFPLFCLRKQDFVSINAKTYPNMTIREVSHACVSIPWIHGSFEIADLVLIDPIFSKKFSHLRRSMLSNKANHLYANHKKNGRAGYVSFIQNEDIGKPDTYLALDFIKFYFGIKNKRIVNTHASILKNGFLNNDFLVSHN